MSRSWARTGLGPILTYLHIYHENYNSRPAVPIIIEDCGVLEIAEPYDVSKRDAPSDVMILNRKGHLMSYNLYHHICRFEMKTL